VSRSSKWSLSFTETVLREQCRCFLIVSLCVLYKIRCRNEVMEQLAVRVIMNKTKAYLMTNNPQEHTLILTDSLEQDPS
jgi:hypothetical protein